MTDYKVLDTYALVAFFEDERGSEYVDTLFKRALSNEIALAVSVVNLGELYYIISRKHSHELAEEIIDDFFDMGVDIIIADWELTQRASKIKAEYPLSYADCFAAALASQLNCPVVTGDPEFKRVGKKVTVEWI